MMCCIPLLISVNSNPNLQRERHFYESLSNIFTFTFFTAFTEMAAEASASESSMMATASMTDTVNVAAVVASELALPALAPKSLSWCFAFMLLSSAVWKSWAAAQYEALFRYACMIEIVCERKILTFFCIYVEFFRIQLYNFRAIIIAIWCFRAHILILIQILILIVVSIIL